MSRYGVMLDSGDFVGNVVDVDDILTVLREVYGDIDDDCGCYVNGTWLSVRDVVSKIVDNAYVA